jgi:hypothetical protein
VKALFIRGLKRLSLVGAMMLSGTLATNATVYYVDQKVGDDGNSGTTPGLPWKNCPGMSAYAGRAVLCPGDAVYFKRDEKWLVSGPQGIYLTGGVRYIGNSWGSGNGKARILAATDLDAGVVRFRDHPTFETVFEGFEVDGNGKVATGIDINHRYSSLMNGATKRIKDCEVHNTWSRQILGQYKYGIIVSNCGGADCYAENVEIVGCIVHDTSRDGICLYPGDQNEKCRIKNIILRGCDIYNTGQDPDYGAGAGIVVKGYVQDAIIECNFVHDTKGALMFINGNENRHYDVGPTNIRIRYNVFCGDTTHGSIRVYDGRSGKDPKDLKIYGNLICNNTAAGGFYIGSDLGNRLTLRVYNNTFYNAPVIISDNRASVAIFEFKNNIVYCHGGVPLLDTKGQITSHSNNIFYGTDRTLVRSNSVDYDTNSLTNRYERTASCEDPRFKNAANLPTGFARAYGCNLMPNSDGLSLDYGSPGIGRGIALGRDFAGSINCVSRSMDTRWDIGAYQSPPVYIPSK